MKVGRKFIFAVFTEGCKLLTHYTTILFIHNFLLYKNKCLSVYVCRHVEQHFTTVYEPTLYYNDYNEKWVSD